MAAGADAVHPRIRLPVRGCRVRAGGPGGRPDLDRSARRRDRGHGLQDHFQEAGRRGRRPVLPGLAPGEITNYPVLVKASAGGGGRGMRVVRGPGELQAALESARREAESAFGDGTVFCEPLLPRARHVEVQVLADADGTIWALTERDCSVQRRHQKVIEETPSPAVDPPLRERLLAAAKAVTAAVGYLGAGTGAASAGRPRRAVLLSGIQHQAAGRAPGHRVRASPRPGRAAARHSPGAALPPCPPAPAGHAIEARLYAEDPADAYRPATGPVRALDVPGAVTRFGPPARRRRPRPPAGLRRGGRQRGKPPL